MIIQSGEIIDIEHRGENITIYIPITVGHPIKLHPGPVLLTQDGNPARLNRQMYIVVASIKNALETGIDVHSKSDLLTLLNKTLKEIEADEDLMAQVKE